MPRGEFAAKEIIKKRKRYRMLNIDEHDEVTIQGLSGSQRGQMGSIPGLKYKVIAINGVDLRQIVKGKKEKPKR